MQFSLIPDSETVKTVLTTVLSCFGLYLGYRRFLLKEGIKIRGAWTLKSSNECEDKFISSVILENVKDRAVTIYSIYMKIGYNYYMEVHNFEDTPMTLKGFETFQLNCGPLENYSVNLRKVRLNDLLSNRRVKKTIVLSTTQGRYVVRKRLKAWNPVTLYFSNHYTGIINPHRSTYKGKNYGGNVVYFINIHSDDGTDHVIPIYRSDYDVRIFKGFILPKSSLESRDALERYLTHVLKKGLFHVKTFEVHSASELKKEGADIFSEGPVHELHPLGWFQYYIYGRFHTWRSEKRMADKNRKTLASLKK